LDIHERWTQETNEFLTRATGVVHIGANSGQERELYAALTLPVVWVEALPDVFQQLAANIKPYPFQQAYQYLLTDENDKQYEFGVANNDGQSSSIYEFGDHKEIWPDVGYTGTISLTSTTFKTMVERECIDLSPYNALVMDVQGAELLVLKGAVDLLNGFKWIRAECADFEIYKDCCQLKDLDEWLGPRGFNRVRTWQGAGKAGLGHAYEALYEREGKEDKSITCLSPLQSFRETITPFNEYSQFGEDGIIEAVFNKIGTVNRWVLECGAADGVFFSNSRRLIQAGWDALLIEADSKQFEKLGQRYLGNPHVTCFNYRVAPTGAYSLDALLSRTEAPVQLDLAVIDVDGQDYWLWNSLLKYQPRVVVIEFDPNTDPDFIPDIGGSGLAGRDAILRLAYGKLYTPVCRTWCNWVFVRSDLAGLLEGEGIKPASPQYSLAACMSTPRFGPLSTFDCITIGLQQFNIAFFRGEGAFWSQSLTRAIERALATVKPDFILTIDYDALFSTGGTDSDIARLMCLLIDHPDVDVAIPMQMKREGGPLLASTDGEKDIDQPLIPVTLGHFGLTLFRSSVFQKLSKPWFLEQPGPDGSWNEDHVDSDIYFWRNCRENGINFCLAPDVVIGHGEYVVTWPGPTLKPFHQPLNDWRNSGQTRPEQVFNRARYVAAAKNNQLVALEMGA
jgi:2-O-methyltransferase